MAEAELERTQRAESPLDALMKFANSSVGSKVVMALTGLGLWVFIVAHLAGNLTAYLGAQTFNGYAEKLHATPPLLWFVRICLIVGFPLHIFTAIRTTQLNNAARPVPYAYEPKTPATLAAKSMVLSGLVVLAFFAFHLSQFTWRIVGLGADAATLTPYQMLIRGFQQPVIAGFYILAQVLLAAHLSHGLYSMFQHLGVWGKKWTPWLKNAALVVGYGLCAAFASLPLSVLLGIIKP